ncbi:MAG: hypothetical protein JO306_05335 [Gemmatimonadetes bacterium]|nr:hypothetical protein [Gemmatimonadota bacterium]
MSDADLRRILDQLLELHSETCRLGEHEVAFHALAAAGHAAEVLHDVDTLERIAALSREELALIDANLPQHRHSSRSADQRHHRSIFEQLAFTATTMRQRIMAEQVRREAARRVEQGRAGGR